MSAETSNSEVMNSDGVDGFSKEMKINGLNSDEHVACETIQCDVNENEKDSFKDTDSTSTVNSSCDSIGFSPSEHGDSKLSEEPLISDNTNNIGECDDSIKSETCISELENLGSRVEEDEDNVNNLDKSSINPNEASDALAYFDIPLPEIGDTIREVSIDEKLIPPDIPNGVSKSTFTKALKKQSLYNKKKCKLILSALADNNVIALMRAALSEGGLIDDEIRRKVWPKLAGVDIYETSPRPCQKEIEAHPYYNQVVLDVNRSLKRFPPSIHEAQRLMMLDQLVFLIMRVLCKHPEMHYYQGYHDICVTFLLVLGEETAYYVIEKLSRTHLKVFMEKDMQPTIHLLEHMYVLIGKKKPQLKDFLLKSEVGVAYCLSWLITWFGHVLNDYNDVVRLFDFFIVSHPYMPMYLTTAIVLHQEKEILKQDCDMASVHSFLSNISDDLPFEELILESLGLFQDFTPEMLSAENPYIPRSLIKPKKKFSLLQSITKTIKSFVPASNITIPIILATAVVVTAVLYQAYKY